MRFSLLTQAICGAVTVSALGIPDLEERQAKLVDLSMFQGHTFPLLSPEQAAAEAGQNNSNFKPETVSRPNAAQVKVQAAGSCANPAVRYEWRNLSDAHKAAYIKAAKCLFGKPGQTGLTGATNRQFDMQAIHQHMTSIIHNVGQFLPWHRYYLHTYERLLREECGYTGPMTWWDETKDAGHFNTAPMFTESYFGHAPLKTSDNKGTCITSGAFANTELDIGPGQGNTKHCLSRAVDEGLSKSITNSFISSCNSHDNFTDMWKCSYTGPHAYGHDAVGAVMSDVDTSPGDPIFFLHHAFIDRNWRIWQNADKNGRLYQINGYTTQSPPYKTTTLDYTLSSMNIRPDATVRDVMDTEGGYLCYKYDY
ncbi:MAG: hypothetical protein MMC23_002389 [Stictis urceolatum]|nr:hypothetical protein [Stictis urceolata]